jgi:hypothetical protein
VSFSSKIVANDTIVVRGKRPAAGFLAKVFGIDSITVAAHATARTDNVSSVTGVAPITVHYKHPLLGCSNGANPTCNPTFNTPTTLNLEDIHKPGSGNGSGAFGLINLNQGDDTGTADAGLLAEWLLNGYDGSLNLGQYYSAPSANFNNSQFTGSMTTMLGQELLFPVYRLLTGPGSNAKYDIIGWVGFKVTSFDPNGTPAVIYGSFTKYIANGIQVTSGGAPAFGVRSVQLVE